MKAADIAHDHITVAIRARIPVPVHVEPAAVGAVSGRDEGANHAPVVVARLSLYDALSRSLQPCLQLSRVPVHLSLSLYVPVCFGDQQVLLPLFTQACLPRSTTLVAKLVSA